MATDRQLVGQATSDARGVSFASFDESRTYRYSLIRRCAEGPICVWVLLNPSTADERKDDPTIRRCGGFSKSWGFGALEVVNLFAFRATDPRSLWLAMDPVGPKNDEQTLAALKVAGRVVVGGESGPGARPCHVEWIRSIVQQCDAAGVPAFVKQLGAHVVDRNDG